MIQALLPIIGDLAGGWLKGKAAEKAAKSQVKVARAEAEAEVMKVTATHEAGWEKIMAQGTQNSFKDEVVTILVLAPVCLCFIPGLEQTVQNGFDRLSELPQWYTNLVLVVCLSAIGIRGGKQFFGGKK